MFGPHQAFSSPHTLNRRIHVTERHPTITLPGAPRLQYFQKGKSFATLLKVEGFLSAPIIRHKEPAHKYRRSKQIFSPQLYDDNIHNRFKPQAPPIKGGVPSPLRRTEEERVFRYPRQVNTSVSPPYVGPSIVYHRPAAPHTRNDKNKTPPDEKGVLSTRISQLLPRRDPSHHYSPTFHSRPSADKSAKSKVSCAPPVGTSPFRQAYERGTLPAGIRHHREAAHIASLTPQASSLRLHWYVHPMKLDYRVVLPLFLEGLREVKDPYRYLAVRGSMDLIAACPSKLVACMPFLLPPLKRALDMRHPLILATSLTVLQEFILADPSRIGPALVPHYHQLLGASAVINKQTYGNEDRKGEMASSQRRLCVTDLMNETLTLLEITGGRDAFLHIRYMVPTYDSVLQQGVRNIW